MEIRPARVADAWALWNAEVATAEAPGQLLSRPEELALVAFETKIRDLEHSGSYFVAEDNGRLLGHALAEPMGLAAVQHVYRLTIVVHPGETGRGIGTALLKHVQRWAVLVPGLHKIELLVRRTNAGAVRLYKRLGFHEEGILQDRVRLPNGEFVDDIAMAWFPTSRSD